MSTTTSLVLPLLLLLVFAAPPDVGEEPATRTTAGELFERTLNMDGLDAALERLGEALADTTEPYAIDAYELGIGLPARLVLEHRREEALALVQAIRPLFGDHPRYHQELGLAHLRCGHVEEARAALTRASELDNRPDLPWMLDRLDELADLERRKAAIEDDLVPGALTDLDGPYLGQQPPGLTPEVFAPGYLCTTAHEYHINFAPGGREIYFSRGGVGTLVARWTADGWTAPEVVHLIDEDHLTEESNVTADGKSIVFCGRRNVRDPRILYRSERVGEGWGAPAALFPGMYPTASLDGTLYYTMEGKGRDYGAIVSRARTVEGYAEPVLVEGEGINSPFPDAHPWIAPDGSLLIFDSYRQPGMGVYVAFRHDDGSWSRAEPICDRLGIPPVGQPAMSHDMRYLFFCLAGDMYWVDAAFLNELRDQALGG